MLIHNKDDIKFVTEFPCLLGHHVDKRYYTTNPNKYYIHICWQTQSEQRFIFYDYCHIILNSYFSKKYSNETLNKFIFNLLVKLFSLTLNTHRNFLTVVLFQSLRVMAVPQNFSD